MAKCNVCSGTGRLHSLKLNGECPFCKGIGLSNVRFVYKWGNKRNPNTGLEVAKHIYSKTNGGQ